MKTVLVLLSIFFVGCATTNDIWVKPQATSRMYELDMDDCITKTKLASKHISKNFFPDDWDENLGSLGDSTLIDECMEFKGWKLVPYEDAPDKFKAF